jgi:hypothetical protein
MKKLFSILLIVAAMLLPSTVSAQEPEGSFQAFIAQEFHISDTLSVTGTEYYYRKDISSDQMSALVEVRFLVTREDTIELVIYPDDETLYVLTMENPKTSINPEWQEYLELRTWDYLFELPSENLYTYCQTVLTDEEHEMLSLYIRLMLIEMDSLMRIQDQK